jgi:hypothetical protein
MKKNIMNKSIIRSDIKYPDVKDFDNIFRIENIIFTDFNIIASKNYNRIDNIWRNNNITGFNRKKYKISSNIPKIHDTLSYYQINKDFNYKTTYNTYWDTLDLTLIRQKIDKKQRYDSLDYKDVKYGKQLSSPRRFII